MNCSFCGQALFGLVSGFVTLAFFVVIPMVQIFMASVKLVIEQVARIFSR